MKKFIQVVKEEIRVGPIFSSRKLHIIVAEYSESFGVDFVVYSHI